MSDARSNDEPRRSSEEARLEALVELALADSSDGLDATMPEQMFMRTVRLVRAAVAADARDVGDLSSGRAVARAIELASHLPAQRGPDVGARIAAWWSRVRSVLAECTFDESGRLAGAGLRGAATRQASYAIETGPAACEIDLEIGATDEAGRCRVWGQVHALDDSIETVGAAVAAVPAASADAVDPAAVGTVDREGFFELTVESGRYDLAISIGDGPAALVPDLEVP